MNIDLGFNTHTNKTIRLIDIDTPETSGSKSKAGKIAEKYVKNILKSKTIYIHTTEKGSFGRWLAEIYLDKEANKSLNKHLLNKGLAIEYHNEWTSKKLERIIKKYGK